jgi:transcriptional regulator with XRE-family HTH domain
MQQKSSKPVRRTLLMGRGKIPRPARLAEKLIQIRAALGLSQSELIQRLGLADVLIREDISEFERDRRIPPLPVLLEYARVAGIYIDALVDDEVDLPAHLPCSPKSEGVRRRRPKSKET